MRDGTNGGGWCRGVHRVDRRSSIHRRANAREGCVCMRERERERERGRERERERRKGCKGRICSPMQRIRGSRRSSEDDNGEYLIGERTTRH